MRLLVLQQDRAGHSVARGAGQVGEGAPRAVPGALRPGPAPRGVERGERVRDRGDGTQDIERGWAGERGSDAGVRPGCDAEPCGREPDGCDGEVVREGATDAAVLSWGKQSSRGGGGIGLHGVG